MPKSHEAQQQQATIRHFCGSLHHNLEFEIEDDQANVSQEKIVFQFANNNLVHTSGLEGTKEED